MTDPLEPDAVIAAIVLEGFTKKHQEEISEKDYNNLQIALKIVKRYAPERWVATNAFLTGKSEPIRATSGKKRRRVDATVKPH